MAKNKLGNFIGGWAFLVGVVLALVVGLFIKDVNNGVVLTLVIIGLIVGLLNISSKESMPFLMSGAVLVIVSSLGKDVIGVSSMIANTISALLALFVPATVVVAVKNVFSLARN